MWRCNGALDLSCCLNLVDIRVSGSSISVLFDEFVYLEFVLLDLLFLLHVDACLYIDLLFQVFFRVFIVSLEAALLEFAYL